MSFVDGYKFRECRTIRHSWQPSGWIKPDVSQYPKVRIAKEGWSNLVVLDTQCERCSTHRYIWLVKTRYGWERKLNQYRYPGGYLFNKGKHPGESAPTGNDFFTSWIREELSE